MFGEDISKYAHDGWKKNPLFSPQKNRVHICDKCKSLKKPKPLAQCLECKYIKRHAWYLKNKQKEIARAKEWARNNPEKYWDAKRKFEAKYRLLNRDKENERRRNWKDKNDYGEMWEAVRILRMIENEKRERDRNEKERTKRK